MLMGMSQVAGRMGANMTRLSGLSGFGFGGLGWSPAAQVGQNYPGVNPNRRTNPNPPDQVYWFDTAAYFNAAGAPDKLKSWVVAANGPSPIPWPSCQGFNSSGPNPYMDGAGRIKYWKAYDGTVISYDPTDPLNYCPEAALQVNTGDLYNVPNPAAGWAAATPDGVKLPDTWGIGVQGAQGNQLMAAHLMDIFPYAQPCYNSQCPHSFTGNSVDFSNMLWVNPSTGDQYIGDWRVPLGLSARLYGSMADYTAALQAYSMMQGDVSAIAMYGHTTSGNVAPSLYSLPPAIPNTTGPNHYDVSPYMALPAGMTLAQAAASSVTVPNYALLIQQLGPGAKFPVPPPGGSPVPYSPSPIITGPVTPPYVPPAPPLPAGYYSGGYSSGSGGSSSSGSSGSSGSGGSVVSGSPADPSSGPPTIVGSTYAPPVSSLFDSSGAPVVTSTLSSQGGAQNNPTASSGVISSSGFDVSGAENWIAANPLIAAAIALGLVMAFK